MLELEKVNYVWYASYGSNLNRDRFLCYIKGGKPEGSGKVEVGCKDPTLPIEEATYIMHYPLYFAMESGRWQQQGVGFIGLKQDNKHRTYSRKYLITIEQFMDVVKQENNGAALDIDLHEIMDQGYKTIKDSWYGTILYLGNEGGYPVLTFTADWDLDVPFNQPSKEYLSMIIHGLKSTLGLENKEVIDYLSSKPGIDGYYRKADIEQLIK
ncbi:hypothetical protein SAMN05192559_102109 [Halobacillus karajensis]|uniref:Histone deacetylase n=1 Tax=Halobacillus karajensis TaxID=195088 RepID=A0A024P604_9BACI|nr:hypothetical protein [Halobacillus karajensis]CDQ18148.1 hypothetical protein BN982_00398 [Halobacillus karajensis]CDQ24499.1 hypothetical protein BN983_02783 [Halobacillus karajensis]CDQ29253.1 hypothetical protein BN981_03624 [Halobacillus karajensis]SEH58358.1 hypothetical protein SAMN05192559_102109 [Halobacillus karajensis]